MSKRRTIRVTLTEEQFYALAGAVGLASMEWEEIAGDCAGTRDVHEWLGSLRALDNAWHKLAEAWHA